MLRHLLLPLDGSSFGEHALPIALSLARRAKAHLHLLHVHTTLQTAYTEIQLYDPTLDQELRGREVAYLESLTKKVSEVHPAVSWGNVEGEVTSSIRAEADKHQADLVVLTTHARGPMGRFWLGSTTDELLRDAQRPMLLVHPHEHSADLTQEEAPGHLLVPLDGTAFAEQVLPYVADFARLLGARITLMRAIEPVVPMAAPQGVGTFGHVAAHVLDQVEKIHEQLRKEAQSYLDSRAEALRKEGLTVETAVVFDDSPGLGILHHAKACGAEMIAMVTHGRRGLAKLFLGSVTNKVIRGSTLPMLLVRPKE